MSTSSSTDLLSRVQRLAPFPSASDAEVACVTTLQALGEQMLPDERKWFGAELEPRFRAALNAHGAVQPPRTAQRQRFFERVGEHEETRPGLAVEHAEVVCRALAEVLPSETLERFRREFPELSDLFSVPKEFQVPSTPVHPRPDAPPTLADGRPGSNHPLSSAAPHPIAHRHSVARSDDPHAETRLSSTRGTTQEREGTSLSRIHSDQRHDDSDDSDDSE